MHEHVMNNQEHVKNTQEHLRTFKHIQGNLNIYYHTLILNSHHGSTKKQVREGFIPSCKIHMVVEKENLGRGEKETLGRGPKGGGKEELGEEK